MVVAIISLLVCLFSGQAETTQQFNNSRLNGKEARIIKSIQYTILLLRNTVCILFGLGIPKWVCSLRITNNLLSFYSTISHPAYKFSSPILYGHCCIPVHRMLPL